MTDEQLIYNMWYVAAASAEVARGKTVARTLLGQALMIGRDSHGEVFALRDFCPHRGVPLSCGTFDGKTIECCYHGWCFNTAGQCTSVPSISEKDNADINRIKAKAFPCREQDGIIWVFVSAPKMRATEHIPDLPAPPTPLSHSYYHVDSVHFPCDIDHAVIGLMDPSHGPFVHASWWWRKKSSMHEKAKHFAPTELGFKMVRHPPSSNSRAYKVLFGGQPTTEIAFQLPGLRTEHIVAGSNHVVLLTALTPIDEKNTQLHQFFYSTLPLANALKGILGVFGKVFIRQDLTIVKKQQLGLQGEHPGLMLLGDADAQALWYFKLKRDYLEAQGTGQPFSNRIPEKTLHWKS